MLGVNRISLTIPPGITTLVGPNGSGQNNADEPDDRTGAAVERTASPSWGSLPAMPTEFFRTVGYCTQFDSFPRGITGWQFVLDSLMLHGMSEADGHQAGREVARTRAASAMQPAARSPATAKACARRFASPRPLPIIPACWFSMSL